MEKLWTLYAIYFLALLSPGPSVFYILGSATVSRKAALAAALGIFTASCIWVLGTAAGFSVLISGNVHLMEFIRLLGAGYFFFLSYKRARAVYLNQPLNPGLGLKHLQSAQAFYTMGLVTNIHNPKTAVFYLSLFTAFVGGSRDKWFIVLACAGVMALSLMWHSFLALAFSRNPVQKFYLRHQRPLNIALTFLFLALGFYLLRTNP